MLQTLKPQDVEDEELSAEELKERKIMKLLLKVKNGTPPQRKSALRQLTDKARDLGAGPLFNQILPLLMSPTLEDQERHLLVKVRQCCFFCSASSPPLPCLSLHTAPIAVPSAVTSIVAAAMYKPVHL